MILGKNAVEIPDFTIRQGQVANQFRIDLVVWHPEAGYGTVKYTLLDAVGVPLWQSDVNFTREQWNAYLDDDAAFWKVIAANAEIKTI